MGITSISNEKYILEIKELREKLEDQERKCKCEKDSIEERAHRLELDLGICNKKLLDMDSNVTTNINIHNSEEHTLYTNKITLLTNNYEFKLKTCNDKYDDY